MEIHKKQSMWNYPWYAFSLSLPVEKLVPEQHADFPGQTYKDTIPVLFWNRRDGYHRGVYAKGRMYGDDFSYKACSKEEMTRLWNYHIEHENANHVMLSLRGVSQKNRKMRYTKCTCRKSIRSKRISKTWVVLGSVGDGNGKKP